MEAFRINEDPGDLVEQLKKEIQTHFSVASYRALNVEVGVSVSIQVQMQTWSMIIIPMWSFRLAPSLSEGHYQQGG